VKNDGDNARHVNGGKDSSHPIIPPRGNYQNLYSYLIDQQLRRLEKDFLERGGLRERMTRARLAYRSQSPWK
jgi:four helix bundle suffix protein